MSRASDIIRLEQPTDVRLGTKYKHEKCFQTNCSLFNEIVLRTNNQTKLIVIEERMVCLPGTNLFTVFPILRHLHVADLLLYPGRSKRIHLALHIRW